MDLEKKAEEQLGWSPKHIARASQSQIIKALKTPIIQKERVFELDLKTSLQQPKTPFQQQPQPPKTPISPVASKTLTPAELVKSFEMLKFKFNQKVDFRTKDFVTLRTGGDLPFLERAIERDRSQLKTLNTEIENMIKELRMLLTTKQELLQILDQEDPCLTQIKPHIDLLISQIDLLKRTFQETI